MDIRKIEQKEIKSALKLVLDTFMEYEAPDYLEEGVDTFKAFIGDEKAMYDLDMCGAYEDENIIGMIATRNQGNHIALFFVDRVKHNQGIGRKLFNEVIKNSTGELITVNSSPYAVLVYKKLGFISSNEEQVTGGMRYTPMTYTV